MEKRLIVAVALSFLVLLGFQKLFPSQPARLSVAPVASETSKENEMSPRQEVLTSSAVNDPRGKEFFQEKETVLETPGYNVLFTNKGGNLKSLTLREPFSDKIDETIYSAPDSAPENAIFGITIANFPGLGTAEYDVTSGEAYVEYTTSADSILRIKKRYTMTADGEYLTAAVSFKNISSEKVRFSYNMVGPAALAEKNAAGGRAFLEAGTLMGDEVWRVKTGRKKQERSGAIDWTALKGNYFTLILKPFGNVRAVEIDPLANNLKIVLVSETKDLAPMEEITEEYMFYAGVLDEKKLSAMGHGFEKIINYGFFGAVSKVLLSVMGLFHKVFRNWGLAIILLTVTVNIVLLPLTFKSFFSMQQMKQLQPHLQKLRAMHKDNPQKLNKETMELYRKYNVNPLGGCLPMLLQMPIFIALYQGLVKATSLKGAHFLWIKDLSAPDSAIKLPFTAPFVGSDINILPLLMVGAMFLQQKFSQASGGMSEEQAQQQKMMMVMMPVMFGVFFYKMPSGLVLYWLTNTVLMTLEQKIIAKKAG